MSERARKVVYVLTFALLTFVGLLGAIFCMWLLTTTNNASVTIYNRSQTTLRNVILAAPGQSMSFDDIRPGLGGGFATDPHFRYEVRVAFDAGGQRYDTVTRLHMLPIGDTIVSAYVDDRMKVSVRAKPTFMY